jgi:F0F1-type ATP synthase membrane subunit b/b'
MQIIPEPIPTAVLVVPFVMTLLALWGILFKPLFDYLEQRDAVAAKALAEADHFRRDSAARLTDIEARLSAARKESGDHRSAARAKAQKEEAAIVKQARAAADARVAEAVGVIERQRESASTALRSSVGDLARDLTRQVLGREV